MSEREFQIEQFTCLPTNLKKSDYVDILLLLIGIKPCVRLGSNDSKVYDAMRDWCKKNQYSYIVSSEQFMYISKFVFIAKVTQLVDDSTISHSYILGNLLGYPKCCCKKISSIGEGAIDSYEKELCDKQKFIEPFDIINPIGYTEGYSFIAHVPCCSTCKKSLDIAKRVKHVVYENRSTKCMESWIDKWYIREHGDAQGGDVC